jgi:hypothetical protein
MNESKHTYHKEGVNVVVKTDVPKLVLTPKNIIERIDWLRNSIARNEAQITQLKQQLEQGEKNSDELMRSLKEIQKYEKEALIVQESKAKAIYEEVKDECFKQVNEEYKEDKSLDERGNKMQKYHLYERKISTSEQAKNELAPRIIKKYYFTDSIIDNPFK